jgi:hypothetical protein
VGTVRVFLSVALLGAMIAGSAPAALAASQARFPAPSGKPFTTPFPSYFAVGSGHREQAHDAAGIVMVRYDGMLRYNPVTIEQATLFDYSDWLRTHSARERARFLRGADWLVANQTADGLWLYDFAFDGQPVPWWSAMAEGQGISVLVRAYHATHVDAYRAAAASALATFTRSTANRGVSERDNGTWYEEYLPPSHDHVLNGMIFAMMGLRDYQQEFGDSLSKSLWDAGVSTLVRNVWRFDAGNASYYCTDGHVASSFYHQVNIGVLRQFYDLTGMAVFKRYADRFESYRVP